MTAYVIRRLLQTLLLLCLASAGIFLLVHARGGDTVCFDEACRESQHLNDPIVTQYLYFLSRLLHLDFGTTVTGDSINGLVLQKLPPTIILVAVSLIIQQIIALPIGVLSAVRQYSFLDSLVTLLSYIALSLPVFVLGLVLIVVLGAHLNLLPVGHNENSSLPLLWSADWFDALRHDPALILGDLARHLILPVTTLTITGIAVDSRFMRASMLQVLHQDYIRTAKAKGLSRARTIFKHAFRNALLPVITNLGLYLPALIGGVIAVEAVFSWDGLGYLFYASAGLSSPVINAGQLQPLRSAMDMRTLETLLLLSTVTVLLANLLADLTYAWLDPRVRLGAGEEA